MTLSSQANENIGLLHPIKLRQSRTVPPCTGARCNIGQMILILVTCFVVNRYVAYVYR
jgi:hypothetical protein